MRKLIILFSLFFSIFFSDPVFAAESGFSASSDPAVGGFWRLHLTIKTPDQKINAVGGKVVFPEDILEVADIEKQNSLVNLWVESPQTTNGQVEFAGVTPGGFAVSEGELFTIVFRVKIAGSGTIRLDQPEFYLNDGRGTRADVKVSDYNFKTRSGTGEALDIAPDALPPQPFYIALGRNSEVFSGKWFVAFVTEDKESGIDHFEVQEAKGEPTSNAWQKAQSPYELKDQSLSSYIYVRAVDKKGNATISKYPPTPHKISYLKPLFWSILIVFSGCFVIICLYIRKQRTKK